MSSVSDFLRCLGIITLTLTTIANGYSQLNAPTHSSSRAEEWFCSGTTHLVNSEWAPALESFTNALKDSSDIPLHSAIHQNLGALYFLLSDYQKSLIHFEHAYQLVSRMEGMRNRESEICINLGFTWLERGSPVKARQWFDLAESGLAENHSLTPLRVELGRGNVCFAMKAYSEAVCIFQKALQTCHTGQPLSNEELWLRKNLAWSYHALGSIDSAQAALGHAIDRIRQSPSENPYEESELLLQRSIFSSVAGDLKLALEDMNQSLAIIGREDDEASGLSGALIQLSTTDVMRYRILCERVLVKWRLLKSPDSLSTTADSLFQEVMEALNLGEMLAGTNPLAELVSIQPDLQREVAGAGFAVVTMMDRDPLWKTDASLLLASRVEHVEQRLLSMQPSDPLMLPDSLSTKFFRLKTQLFRLHKQRHLEEGSHLIQKPELVDKGASLLDSLVMLDHTAAKMSTPPSAQSPGRIHPRESITSQEIRRLLSPGEALIKYTIVDSTLVTLLFTCDTAIVIRQQAGVQVATEAELCLTDLKRLDQRSFARHSRSLYHCLIQPVRRYLSGKPLLWIVPDRPLLSFPFEALIADSCLRSNDVNSYLLRAHEITYCLSIDSWIQQRKRLSDPCEPKVYEYEFGAIVPSFPGARMASIPEAVQEVSRISGMFRAFNKKARTMTGLSVHPDSLIALGSQSRILHLATHGYTDQDYPEFSGWFLPGDPKPSPILSAHESHLEIGSLQSFRMPCDLVVFSTCAVGNNPVWRWYRYRGFPANFFDAGVRHVLFSLWDVSDSHTNGFMYIFYNALLKGKSYSASLREAKLKMLSAPGTSLPALWAVFVLWSN